jgi:RNA polymerase sigma-32 factor
MGKIQIARSGARGDSLNREKFACIAPRFPGSREMTTHSRRKPKPGRAARGGASPGTASSGHPPGGPSATPAAKASGGRGKGAKASRGPKKRPAGGGAPPETAKARKSKTQEARSEEAGPEVLTPEVVAEPEDLSAESVALPVEPEILDDLPAAVDGEIQDAAKARDRSATTLPVPAARDLSHADALQRYLADIARHPLLSREEEHELAVRFVETRDPVIAWRLVTANLRLVVKIANEYRRAAFNVLDLIQEGNVGLMQAVQKYDPFRGVKLSSYAAWWIRAYIIRYLMDNWRMVKLGTTQAQRKLFFNLRKEQEKMLSQGYEAQPRLLAERLDVSEQDVREMDQRLGNDEFSLDTPLSGGSDDSRQTYMDRLGDAQRGADDKLGEEELRRVFKEKLAAFGAQLTGDKDRFLFAHRISLPDGQEPMTLQEVGDKYGFTRERARQLEARLMERLRDHLRKEMPDFAQLSVNAPEED